MLIRHERKIVAAWAGEPDALKLLYFDMIMSFIEDSVKAESAVAEPYRQTDERRPRG